MFTFVFRSDKNENFYVALYDNNKHVNYTSLDHFIKIVRTFIDKSLHPQRHIEEAVSTEYCKIGQTNSLKDVFSFNMPFICVTIDFFNDFGWEAKSFQHIISGYLNILIKTFELLINCYLIKASVWIGELFYITRCLAVQKSPHLLMVFFVLSDVWPTCDREHVEYNFSVNLALFLSFFL